MLVGLVEYRHKVPLHEDPCRYAARYGSLVLVFIHLEVIRHTRFTLPKGRVFSYMGDVLHSVVLEHLRLGASQLLHNTSSIFHSTKLPHMSAMS